MKTTPENALEAVLLFYSASPWTEAKRTQWWNLTQTNEATTRNLCDTARYALGRLPSCFGDFAGRAPTELPADLRLSNEQLTALDWLEFDIIRHRINKATEALNPIV